MSSKLTKKIFIFLAIALVSLIAIIVLWLTGLIKTPSFIKSSLRGKPEDSIQQSIKIIKEYPTDIMVYGDDISFNENEEVPHRKINEINDSTLKRESKYKHSFLVINDMSNKVKLTSETIKLIKDYVYKKGYTVMYFGDKYISAWDDNQYITNVEDGESVVIQNEAGNVVRVVGNWGKEEAEMAKNYPYLQSQVLIYQVESFIRANN